MEDEVLQGIGLVLTVFLALVWFLLLRKFKQAQQWLKPYDKSRQRSRSRN